MLHVDLGFVRRTAHITMHDNTDVALEPGDAAMVLGIAYDKDLAEALRTPIRLCFDQGEVLEVSAQPVGSIHRVLEAACRDGVVVTDSCTLTMAVRALPKGTWEGFYKGTFSLSPIRDDLWIEGLSERLTQWYTRDYTATVIAPEIPLPAIRSGFYTSGNRPVSGVLSKGVLHPGDEVVRIVLEPTQELLDLSDDRSREVTIATDASLSGLLVLVGSKGEQPMGAPFVLSSREALVVRLRDDRRDVSGSYIGLLTVTTSKSDPTVTLLGADRLTVGFRVLSISSALAKAISFIVWVILWSSLGCSLLLYFGAIVYYQDLARPLQIVASMKTGRIVLLSIPVIIVAAIGSTLLWASL